MGATYTNYFRHFITADAVRPSGTKTPRNCFWEPTLPKIENISHVLHLQHKSQLHYAINTNDNKLIIFLFNYLNKQH